MGNSAGVRALGSALSGFSSTYFPAKAAQKDKAFRDSVTSAVKGAEATNMARTLPDYGSERINDPDAPSKRKGGRIKRTGIYRLHKNEVVIPAKVANGLGKRKASRFSGRR